MPYKLLCISNDEVLTQVRQLLFEREGYEVTSAFDLTEAMNQCRAGTFDVVFIGHSVAIDDVRALVGAIQQHCNAPIVTVRYPNDPDIPGARCLNIGQPL